MVYVQLGYLVGDLKCVAQYDCYYRLNLRTAIAGQIAVSQLSGLFQAAGAGDLEIECPDGQGLSAPAWPYDLNLGERQNTPR